MLPVIRTARADEDLIDIWTPIAADNPEVADRVPDAIEARWDQLARQPYSGPARDDIAPGIRHLAAGRYLTLYRVTEAGIEIIRVLRARRNIGRRSLPP